MPQETTLHSAIHQRNTMGQFEINTEDSFSYDDLQLLRKKSVERFKKGPWSKEEDAILRDWVAAHGPQDWSCIQSKGLLMRKGKSCRLRWLNILRPGLKKGRKFSREEEEEVIRLQAQFGNKWASIAKFFPGRTDNDVKNLWSMRKKRLARNQQGSFTSVSRCQNDVHPSSQVCTCEWILDGESTTFSAEQSQDYYAIQMSSSKDNSPVHIQIEDESTNVMSPRREDTCMKMLTNEIEDENSLMEPLPLTHEEILLTSEMLKKSVTPIRNVIFKIS